MCPFGLNAFFLLMEFKEEDYNRLGELEATMPWPADLLLLEGKKHLCCCSATFPDWESSLMQEQNHVCVLDRMIVTFMFTFLVFPEKLAFQDQNRRLIIHKWPKMVAKCLFIVKCGTKILGCQTVADFLNKVLFSWIKLGLKSVMFREILLVINKFYGSENCISIIWCSLG